MLHSLLLSVYCLRIHAADYNTGEWRDLYLDNVLIKPRDDALNSLEKLSTCDPFMMMGPYQELDLSRQPTWMISGGKILDVKCPLRRIKKDAGEAAKGTVIARLFTPSHEMFVQKPYPLVISESRHREPWCTS
jgi:hypothetical protein